MCNLDNINFDQNNILVLGNGFDLYHGLPTKYGDFLDFIKNWNVFYDKYKNLINSNSSNIEYKYIELKNYYIDEENMKKLASFYKMYNIENIEKFNTLIKSNNWITYFLESVYENKGWIDFESEIEDVILYIKEVISSSNKKYLFSPHNSSMNVFNNYIKYVCEEDYLSTYDGHKVTSHYMKEDIVDSKLLLGDLKEDLNNLILCLNIYLLEFVNNMKELKRSPDISNLKLSKIISFNYTNTYEKIYKSNDDLLEIHYLHGKIGNENNIVLGMKDDKIDENELDYVYFFKYFQRIQKKTGNLYRKWINKAIKPRNKFFIFGHSLDESDKDILRDIITAKDTLQVTIFYRDQPEMEKFIINLIKILSKEDMIRYTSDDLIVFKQLSN